jgi:hypothetical protein
MHSNVKNKKSRKISCCCTATEKRYIEIRARKAGFSASEYLREMALRDYLKKPKTLPPEVLAFDGRLLQLAATLQPWPANASMPTSSMRSNAQRSNKASAISKT